MCKIRLHDFSVSYSFEIIEFYASLGIRRHIYYVTLGKIVKSQTPSVLICKMEIALFKLLFVSLELMCMKML